MTHHDALRIILLLKVIGISQITMLLLVVFAILLTRR